MGNEQSGPRTSRTRSSPSTSRRSPRPQKPAGAEDDAVPPPYSPIDTSGNPGRQFIAPSSSLQPPQSRPVAFDPPLPAIPTQPMNPTAHIPGATVSTEHYVGGFRFQADPFDHVGPPGIPPPSAVTPTAPAQASGTAPNSEGATVRRSNTQEDILEMLRKYNTLVVVDDSSSVSCGSARAAVIILKSNSLQIDGWETVERHSSSSR